jgi:putative Ca2+/H+ antiporter (TMEM165/GDT1 family)
MDAIIERLSDFGGSVMDSLFISTGVVTLAEMGDKNNSWHSSLPHASRGRYPSLLALVINHGLAGALGAWITQAIRPDVLRWLLAASFIGMAIWTMIPDKIEEEETQISQRLGVFGATLITFFLAEMGDKTQIATVAMAAHYGDPRLAC